MRQEDNNKEVFNRTFYYYVVVEGWVEIYGLFADRHSLKFTFFPGAVPVDDDNAIPAKTGDHCNYTTIRLCLSSHNCSLMLGLQKFRSLTARPYNIMITRHTSHTGDEGGR
jgi:hypothetical protein